MLSAGRQGDFTGRLKIGGLNKSPHAVHTFANRHNSPLVHSIVAPCLLYGWWERRLIRVCQAGIRQIILARRVVVATLRSAS